MKSHVRISRSLPALFYCALTLGLLFASSDVAARLPKNTTTEILDDGMEIVVVRKPNAKQVSMRFIVKAGGKDDGPGLAGTAHMLEHLIFQGTYVDREGLFKSTRNDFAMVDAFTSTDWTVYVLDADKNDFARHAERYIKMITNPALMWVDLKLEKKIIDGEHQIRSLKSIGWALDQQLFPSLNQGQTVIGTLSSRKAINDYALRDFYSLHYRPKKTIALFSGNITHEEAKGILKRSVLFPPRRDSIALDETSAPALPSEKKQRSSGLSVTVGYSMRGVDRDTCRSLAAVAERRLVRSVLIDEPLAQVAKVRCISLRQELLLFAVAFASTPTAFELPERIDEVLLGLRFKPPRSAEISRLKARERSVRNKMRENPSGQATELAFVLGESGADTQQVLQNAEKALRFSKKKMKKAANKNIQKENRFSLQLSPFKG
ncbi:MAG: insulinase family protein [Deltaproteobacteria bacterium]|nr:insulinase family protein [Deltaproteobacteria bacterium]